MLPGGCCYFQVKDFDVLKAEKSCPPHLLVVVHESGLQSAFIIASWQVFAMHWHHTVHAQLPPGHYGCTPCLGNQLSKAVSAAWAAPDRTHRGREVSILPQCFIFKIFQIVAEWHDVNWGNFRCHRQVVRHYQRVCPKCLSLPDIFHENQIEPYDSIFFVMHIVLTVA